MPALLTGLVLLTLFGSTGCKSLGLGGEKKTDKTLAVAVDSFNNSVRWGNYNGAVKWLDPVLKEQYWPLTEKLQERVRLTDFELRPDDVTEGTNTVQVIIKFKLYSPDDPRIETKTLRQVWHYDEELKAWRVVKHDLEALLR